MIKKLTIISAISFCLLSGCANGIDKKLHQFQWVSNKLYEAPDYRDTILFNADSTITYFDAGSSQKLSGFYTITTDTIRITVFHSILSDTLYQRFILKNDTLRVVNDNGKLGKWHFYSAPQDREIL